MTLNVRGDNMLWGRCYNLKDKVTSVQRAVRVVVIRIQNIDVKIALGLNFTVSLARLKSLGLRIQLGHALGHACPNPHRAFNDDFTIIDSHGVHKVSLDFCDCTLATTHVQQLLRMSLFPSTTADPKTAATFCLLEEFHLLSFELKVSAYEFYHALMQRSDNMGISPIKDQYNSFMRMIREWRHLKMLNLPTALEKLTIKLERGSLHQSWLYGLFLAIDANFWLKRKVVSKDSVDPSLSNGWGYFVKESVYKGFLNDNLNVNQEKSNCSSHNAVNMADTKSNHGLVATGLGTIDCARHNMKLPTAVGDLQKGEKYINMDYLFFSTLQHTMVDVLNVSYDIPTFNNVKLSSHSILHPASDEQMVKLQSDASSTKEMGPGTRRDMLDDFFGDWNWRKITGLYITLASVCLELAKEEASEIELSTSHILHGDCSPSMLISGGLELEEQQQVWAFMPQTLKKESSFNAKLQYTQAHDTLRSLRSNLYTQTAVLKYKDRNLHGQGANTRARNTLKGINARIDVASNRYQDAHKALVVLAPLIKEAGWQSSLHPLNREDIWGMSDLLWGQTKGRHKLSWIWNMWGAHGDELGNDGIEWCKARAHAMRWKEEVELLREEMQSILQFFDWQATSWDEHTNQSWSESPAEREGKIAYAQRQAALRRVLWATCHSSWEDTCTFIDQFHANPSVFSLGHP
ncbi:hypothetical protein EV702DRAFT_1048489 [Suillus placidus]|uniref:CxC2-like cysteine cluster KDZ transposase-associated domain-containing protein n=1 Tax=Suillus placidus TaxID=48579 RepID=A0A9P7D003_9AGAM|nr:hypothetical protein EV702DRAFT_1048489 [Suillus placidus]